MTFWKRQNRRQKTETENRLVVVRDWEHRKGLTIKGHEIFGGDRNVLCLDRGGYMTECICKNSLNCTLKA